jgi:hypothetical protein
MAYPAAAFCWLIIVLFVIVPGCQTNPDPPAHRPVLPVNGCSVSGKVVCNDRPVPNGLVQFFSENRLVGVTSIGASGEYEMRGVPEGEVQICLMTTVYVTPGMPVPGPNNPMLRPPGLPAADGVPPGFPMPPAGGPPVPPLPGDGEPKAPEVPDKGAAAGPADPLAKFPEDVKKMLAGVQEAYSDPAKTPLRYTVRPGRQTHDLVLNLE